MRLEKLPYSYFYKKIRPTVFDSGVGAKLPPEYRKFYNEWKNTPPKPVHYVPYEGKRFVREETGEVKRIEDVPIKGIYTKELHNVFTGGEMIIQGFKKGKKKFSPAVPKFWVPVAYKSVIYSEILNKYMSTMMTKRVVNLIHENRGLDFYLLRTKACDLGTLVALSLKRKLLLALRDKDLPYDEAKNQKILEKYQEYLLPPEEVEWYGLSFTEACRKLEEMEKEQEAASIIPLKHVYRAQLIQQLKEPSLPSEEPISKESTLMSKIPWINKLRKSPESS